MTLRVLVVDDEAPARRRIRRLLAGERGVTVVGERADGRAAIDAIARERPHLIFLDVQMPELDGFEVIARLPDADMPAIVFATAFDRYAMQAFDVHAIDYLLKPFPAERFRLALARARERIEARQTEDGLLSLAAAMRRRYLSSIAVKTRGRTVLIDVGGIERIEAAGNYVRLIAGDREHIARVTLATLEKQLDPAVFVRIHRSTIVRIDSVREFRAASHGDMSVVLRSGATLTLSRTWRERVRQVFTTI